MKKKQEDYKAVNTAKSDFLRLVDAGRISDKEEFFKLWANKNPQVKGIIENRNPHETPITADRRLWRAIGELLMEQNKTT